MGTKRLVESVIEMMSFGEIGSLVSFSRGIQDKSRLHRSLTILKTFHELVFVRLGINRGTKLSEVVLNKLARETKLGHADCSEVFSGLQTIGIALRVVGATGVQVMTGTTPFDSGGLRGRSRGCGIPRRRFGPGV